MPPDDDSPTGGQTACRRVDRSERSSYLIGVDGRSGSGKTDLAAVLAAALGTPAQPVPVVHVDELVTGWEGLAEGVRRLVDGVLAPLAQGRPARLQRWNWMQDNDGDVVALPWAPVVVVEGVGAGAAACRPYLSLLLWLELDTAQRYQRAMARDGDTFAPWWSVWSAQEDVYLAAADPARHADVVVQA